MTNEISLQLLEALKELKEASGAMARVIVAGGLTENLRLELERCQILHGFGKKASDAIAAAEATP